MKINRNKLSIAVRVKRGRLGLREAADVAGVSHQTLHNVEKERPINADSFAVLCDWLDVPMDYFRAEEGEDEEDVDIRSGAAGPEKVLDATV